VRPRGVAAVDDDEALGMAQQKDRNLEAAERECAAVEEVEL
jgi:hypothetical protein